MARWWARRLWKLPIWAWIVAAVVVIGAIGAAAGGDSGGDEATESPATAVTAVDSTTIAETATTRSMATTATIPATTAAETPSDADVPWENYAAQVRQRINDLATTGDCAGLHGEFDTADANNEMQRDRTGTGNSELMGYLDALMRAAGCPTPLRWRGDHVLDDTGMSGRSIV